MRRCPSCGSPKIIKKENTLHLTIFWTTIPQRISVPRCPFSKCLKCGEEFVGVKECENFDWVIRFLRENA